MNKKVSIIAIVFIFIIIVGLLTIFATQRKQDETGASIKPFTEQEKNNYDQLYELLDRGVIIQPEFDLIPNVQRRTFEIRIKNSQDIDKVKSDLNNWLTQNRFDKIPKDKFIFNE